MESERRQTQEEAEQWQNTSIRIIHRVRLGIALCFLLGVGWLFIRNVGFPKNVDEALPACVITSGGEVISCEIVLKGEVTSYPFQSDKYGMDDRVKVWFKDRWLVELEYYHGTFAYAIADDRRYDDTVSAMMSRNRDMLIMELDVKTIFPEKESQRCVLIAPAESKSIALEQFSSVPAKELINALAWVQWGG